MATATKTPGMRLQPHTFNLMSSPHYIETLGRSEKIPEYRGESGKRIRDRATPIKSDCLWGANLAAFSDFSDRLPFDPELVPRFDKNVEFLILTSPRYVQYVL